LYALLTVSLVLVRSQLKTYVRKTFVAGPLYAPLVLLSGLSRVINSVLRLLTYEHYAVFSVDPSTADMFLPQLLLIKLILSWPN